MQIHSVIIDRSNVNVKITKLIEKKDYLYDLCFQQDTKITNIIRSLDFITITEFCSLKYTISVKL